MGVSLGEVTDTGNGRFRRVGFAGMPQLMGDMKGRRLGDEMHYATLSAGMTGPVRENL
jgi:hypothetical protein